MIRRRNKNRLLSVVVSAYNEEAVLEEFYNKLSDTVKDCDCDYELLIVNDGSTDGTEDVIRKLAAADSKVKALCLSRNFGHEAAMTAGIDYADGDYIICMDADLQHPVEYIPEILKTFAEGSDVTLMVRKSNKSAGFFKNMASNCFYALINKLSKEDMEPGASDFFGITRKAADVLRSDYRERVRFMRGYVQNVGFKVTKIEYDAGERAAGESKYDFRKLFNLSIDSIVCFSDVPLRLGMYAGVFAAILGIIMTVYTIITWATRGAPSGYSTIVVLICFMFAVLFFIVGIIGKYISVIFTEVKGRPVYIVGEKINIE